MAAGLGFKDFATGEVLTAADVDGYLMQGIWVFASAAARDAAVTSPQEGNACYLKDTNQVLTYSGSAWVAVGGGSPLTTKGDLYGFSTVDARIPIGANNTVLTADSAQALGLKWAAPASPTFSGVRVRKSANQSISNATETVLTFDTETFDTDAYHDNSTNSGRLTVPAGKAGYYNIYFCIQWDLNATGDREVSLYINGTSTRICANFIAGDATTYPFCNGTTTYYLAETDYVQLTGYQTSGGALNATNSATISFGMDKVG
jgi:hypothetical protein